MWRFRRVISAFYLMKFAGSSAESSQFWSCVLRLHTDADRFTCQSVMEAGSRRTDGSVAGFILQPATPFTFYHCVAEARPSGTSAQRGWWYARGLEKTQKCAIQPACARVH